jgi:hypothetical protein
VTAHNYIDTHLGLGQHWQHLTWGGMGTGAEYGQYWVTTQTVHCDVLFLPLVCFIVAVFISGFEYVVQSDLCIHNTLFNCDQLGILDVGSWNNSIEV